MTTRILDAEQIRETLVALGEALARVGFEKPLADIEGNGKLGNAVRDPRDADSLRIIHTYLKGLARELLAEETQYKAQYGHASKEIVAAKRWLDEAWQHFKAAVQ
jgi:hypothetical protein